MGLRQQGGGAVRALRLSQTEGVGRLRGQAVGELVTCGRAAHKRRQRCPQGERARVAVSPVQLFDAAQCGLNAAFEAGYLGGEGRQQGQQLKDLLGLAVARKAREVVDGEYGVHAAPLAEMEAGRRVVVAAEGHEAEL